MGGRPLLMLSLVDIEQAVEAYSTQHVSLDQFADWFARASRGMFGESKEVLEACISIEQAFSALHLDGISEEEFSKELAAAIRPFAISPSLRAQSIVYGEFIPFVVEPQKELGLRTWEPRKMEFVLPLHRRSKRIDNKSQFFLQPRSAEC